MSEQLELAQRVLELDKEATPGEWGYQAGMLKHYVFSTDGKEDFGVSLQEFHWQDGHEVPAAANAKLIAEYRTAAPKLAQAVKEQETEIERLRALSLDLTKYELLWLMDVANTKDSIAGEVFARLAEYGRVRYGIEEAPGEKEG